MLSRRRALFASLGLLGAGTTAKGKPADKFETALLDRGILDDRKQLYAEFKKPSGFKTEGIDLASWDAGVRSLYDPSTFTVPVFGGLALGSSLGVSALVLVFPQESGKYVVVPHYWAPEHSDDWRRLKRTANPPEMTEGDVIDFETIEGHVERATKQHQIQEIGFDPFMATETAQILRKRGVPMVEINPGVRFFSGAVKTFLGLLEAGRIVHSGHSTLRREMADIYFKIDGLGNMYPGKSGKKTHIVGAVAMIMALERAVTYDSCQAPAPGAA